jgi:hypothetical protein
LAGRTGIDLDPPDLRDPDDRRWLLACIWPDTGRLERTATAIDLAAADPPEVVVGDALDLLPDVLDGLGPGLAVVTTTWSFSYLVPDGRHAFVDILRRAGHRRPVVWVAGDGRGVVEAVDPDGHAGPDGNEDCDVLTAVRFAGGSEEARLLALVQSHGRWLDWRD